MYVSTKAAGIQYARMVFPPGLLDLAWFWPGFFFGRFRPQERVPALSQIYYQDRPQNGEYSRWGNGPHKQKQKNPRISAGADGRSAARGGVDASRPGKARPEPAASGDNLARLASALGLKCLHLPTQLTPAAPCGQADSAGTLVKWFKSTVSKNICT